MTADPTNTSSNARGLFWPTGQTPMLDAESCARWQPETPTTHYAQEGATLRVRTNPDGSTDAITVTKNIWFGAIWVFNEHTWNTAASPVLTIIGQFNLQSVFDPSGDPSRPAPLPWDLCAKTIGATLSFVAWLDNTPRPDYGDPKHGGSVTVPAAYVYPGQAGWYIGHLNPGQASVFDHRTAQPVVL